MGRQSELFEKPTHKRVVMMHVSDVDCSCGGPDGPVFVELKCDKCGLDGGRWKFITVTEARRGLPCPKCSPDAYEVRVEQ